MNPLSMPPVFTANDNQDSSHSKQKHNAKETDISKDNDSNRSPVEAIHERSSSFSVKETKDGWGIRNKGGCLGSVGVVAWSFIHAHITPRVRCLGRISQGYPCLGSCYSSCYVYNRWRGCLDRTLCRWRANICLNIRRRNAIKTKDGNNAENCYEFWHHFKDSCVSISLSRPPFDQHDRIITKSDRREPFLNDYLIKLSRSLSITFLAATFGVKEGMSECTNSWSSAVLRFICKSCMFALQHHMTRSKFVTITYYHLSIVCVYRCEWRTTKATVGREVRRSGRVRLILKIRKDCEGNWFESRNTSRWQT